MEEVIFKPDHIAISVSDLERSLEWYANMFGFATKVKFERKDLQVRGAIMRLGPFGLEMFESYNPTPLPEYQKDLLTDLGVIGTKHFALQVNDIYSARDYLSGRGAQFMGDIVEGKTAKYFFTRDPDGILVEVKQKVWGE